MNNLAHLRMLRNDLASARPLFERALEIQKETLGERHPDTTNTMNNLASLLWVQGDLVTARRHADAAFNSTWLPLSRELPTLSEREQIAALTAAASRLSVALDVAEGQSERDSESFARLLAWKGLAAEAHQARRRASANPELRAQAARIAAIRAAVARQAYARVPDDKVAAQAEMIAKAQARLNELESQLHGAVGWSVTPPDPGRVAAAIPPDATLVDLLAYTRLESPQAGRRDPEFRRHYLAFVVRPGTPPKRVELGSAEAIDSAIARWRAACRSHSQSEARRRVESATG